MIYSCNNFYLNFLQLSSLLTKNRRDDKLGRSLELSHFVRNSLGSVLRKLDRLIQSTNCTTTHPKVFRKMGVYYFRRRDSFLAFFDAKRPNSSNAIRRPCRYTYRPYLPFRVQKALPYFLLSFVIHEMHV